VPNKLYGLTAITAALFTNRYGLEQEREVQRMIRNHVPDQLKMSYALWTRQAVRELILHRYDVLLCVRAVGNYLKRWGFSVPRTLEKGMLYLR
jgi:transposase